MEIRWHCASMIVEGSYKMYAYLCSNSTESSCCIASTCCACCPCQRPVVKNGEGVSSVTDKDALEAVDLQRRDK